GGLRSFSEKITSKGLDRIGPCGWSPRHYLNKNLTLLNKVLLLNNHLSKQQEDSSVPSDQYTALYAAVKTQRMDLIKLTIKNGADINQKSCGHTPLHVAVLQNAEEIVELLLANNASVHEQDKYGRMPLHFSILPAKRNTTRVAELLLDNEAELDQQDYGGDTPLHLAVASENEFMVNFFLDKGANPNKKNGDHSIHNEHNKHMVNFFLEKGVSPNQKKNADESTPLHIAVGIGHQNITRLLLYKKADPEIRNKDGKTALDLAKEAGHTEIIDILENHLSKKNTPNGKSVGVSTSLETCVSSTAISNMTIHEKGKN
ncbi:ankyrin repeat domain-containing protein, partial [Wolbachia pipientis]|uniref:ankyrin repeat domain-containing protein n=1 Tax=Wolbachia pipientis TaxID=955 RepID=UPI0011D11B08